MEREMKGYHVVSLQGFECSLPLLLVFLVVPISIFIKNRSYSLLNRPVSMEMWLEEVAFSLFFFDLFGWMGVFVLSKRLKSQWEMGNDEIETIRETFFRQCMVGKDKIQAIKATFLTQEIVDLKLHELANAVNVICLEEVKLQGNETAEVELEKIKERIRSAKETFWQTWALVSQLGFLVEVKIGDYLFLPVQHPNLSKL